MGLDVFTIGDEIDARKRVDEAQEQLDALQAAADAASAELDRCCSATEVAVRAEREARERLRIALANLTATLFERLCRSAGGRPN